MLSRTLTRTSTNLSFFRRSYNEWSTSRQRLVNYSKSEHVQEFIHNWIKITQPARVHLCDGSLRENEELLKGMVQTGVLIPCNPKIRPNSYLARSAPGDVARVEESTFICSENRDDAGPTNVWREPEATTSMMMGLYEGCMRGRTLYVVPFVMGPVGSPFSQVGIQITDSPYVVVNMRIMTRMGKVAMDMLEEGHKGGEFVPCVHSVGSPLSRTNSEDTTWPCNVEKKFIVHYPEQRKIYSYGSGYGGNALLGKKCFALRIASCMAREEGWLAEHMLIVGITNPKGVKKYFAAAFPSACGKTNLAMMLPKVDGWKVECVGDDIAWMRIGKDGRLWAVNPEAGFFGVAPGTSKSSNPNAIDSLKKNVIFTNVAMTSKGDVWWEGMTPTKPDHLVTWRRTDWYPDYTEDAAHANARFTAPASQCPVIDPNWESPEGVPIDGIIFGGRRSSTVPLVYQSFDWSHGTFIGATMNSETTAAASGKRGVLRSDPMAMKPFCGYNMGDYWNHWLSFSQRTSEKNLPKIFHVNWFRKGANGKFLWPGYGDNIRVMEWIFNRSGHDASTDASIADASPIGYIPKTGVLDVGGLDLPEDSTSQLFSVKPAEWVAEFKRDQQFLVSFGSRLPEGIKQQMEGLSNRLNKAM